MNAICTQTLPFLLLPKAFRCEIPCTGMNPKEAHHLRRARNSISQFQQISTIIHVARQIKKIWAIESYTIPEKLPRYGSDCGRVFETATDRRTNKLLESNRKTESSLQDTRITHQREKGEIQLPNNRTIMIRTKQTHKYKKNTHHQ